MTVASYPNIPITADTVITDFYHNQVILSLAAAPITLTFPVNLTAQFNCLVIQGTASEVNFAAGTGASLNSSQGFTKTGGQYSMVGIMAPTTGNFILVGDGA